MQTQSSTPAQTQNKVITLLTATVEILEKNGLECSPLYGYISHQNYMPSESYGEHVTIRVWREGWVEVNGIRVEASDALGWLRDSWNAVRAGNCQRLEPARVRLLTGGMGGTAQQLARSVVGLGILNSTRKIWAERLLGHPVKTFVGLTELEGRILHKAALGQCDDWRLAQMGRAV